MEIAGSARRAAVVVGMAAVACAHRCSHWRDVSFAQGTPTPPIWTVPEIGALPNDANGQLVRRGRDLVTATYAHIGPEVADPCQALSPATISPAATATSTPAPKMFAHSAVRAVRLNSRIQRPPGRRDHHRGPPQFLHGPQHERASAAGRRPRDAAPSSPTSGFCRPGWRPARSCPASASAQMPELDARRRSGARRRRSTRGLRRLPQHRRQRHPPQPADHRSRLHGAAALGRRTASTTAPAWRG